LLTIKLVSL